MGAIWIVDDRGITAGCQHFANMNDVREHYFRPGYDGVWYGLENEAVAFAQLLVTMYRKRDGK
jgi:hypothetical protein